MKNYNAMSKNEIMLEVYNISMATGKAVVEDGRITLTESDKRAVWDSIGALLSALGVAEFYGVYTAEHLKRDVKNL